jgi:ribulose-phosphate 3-epimerase
MNKRQISASMMCADMLNFGKEIELFRQEGIDYLHVDIMDWHYVRNLTFGPDFCQVLANNSDIPLDIHLLIEDVDDMIDKFTGLNHPIVTFSPEVLYHPIRTLQKIKAAGAQPGIALPPSMPPSHIKPLLPYCDYVSVMTINPGFAGQALVPEALENIREIKRYIDAGGYDIRIEVDGCVSWENMPKMMQAGADIFVAGSTSIFDNRMSRREAIRRMQTILSEGSDVSVPVPKSAWMRASA